MPLDNFSGQVKSKAKALNALGLFALNPVVTVKQLFFVLGHYAKTFINSNGLYCGSFDKKGN